MAASIYTHVIPIARHAGAKRGQASARPGAGTRLVIHLRFVASSVGTIDGVSQEPYTPGAIATPRPAPQGRSAKRLRLVDSRGSLKEYYHAKSLLA